MSGDNANASYNEPKYMEEALMKEGIPSERIYLDYAGFRTLDSIKRANEIFQLDSFYIVTQPFHAIRAQMLAQTLDLKTKMVMAP
ncbi:YdcF family protein [Candidatus Peregrinibacteria bacterium]|nr:YdcF family protein [Candidatus Peregrinibacteria bacterium]MCB9804042.1 YdcF family protein [Candidatus Peribacteria bacterium]